MIMMNDYDAGSPRTLTLNDANKHQHDSNHKNNVNKSSKSGVGNNSKQPQKQQHNGDDFKQHG